MSSWKEKIVRGDRKPPNKPTTNILVRPNENISEWLTNIATEYGVGVNYLVGLIIDLAYEQELGE